MDTPVVEGILLGGRYRLGARLGRGGMAEVFEGLDQRLGRPVAVKLLRPELAANSQWCRRFEAEARAAARLSHPNVVAVYDSGKDAGRSYIVMERVEGETLGDCIARGAIDQRWLTRLAGNMLAALAAAHAAGIVHRDIKPSNILIGPGGQAKLTDFGIAKTMEGFSGLEGDLTATGLVIGTPAYLAPERLQGRPATPQSDLYALGAVLHEALTGCKPFQTDPQLTLADAARQRPPPNPGRLRPGADPRLVNAISRALAADPAARFPTATAMARALHDTGPAPTAVLPIPTPGSPTPETAAAAAHRQRPRWPVLGAAVLAVAIVAAGLIAVLVVDGDHGRPAPSGRANPTGPPTTIAAKAGPSPTVTTPLTEPADPVGSQLRGLALQLTLDGGAAARALAAELTRIAGLAPQNRPAAATALMAQTAGWYQHDQLAQAAYAETINALTDAGGQLPSPTTGKRHGNGHGRGGSGD